MEEATAREFERSLQLMRIKIIEAKGGKGVEGLSPLPNIRHVKKIKKEREAGEKE